MRTIASRDLSTGLFAVLFGFMTGIVLPVATGLLNFRLAQAGADTKTIGLIYVISIPYALSFLTTPLLENLKIPYFSKVFGRSGPVLVILQAIMCLSVYLMGVFDLSYSLKTIVFLTFLMTVAGAAQDNLFGAIRTRMAKGPMQGFVSGMHVTGCRIGMIFAGPIAISASGFFTWTQIHTIISLTIAAFPAIVLTYLFNNKEQAEISAQQKAPIPWKDLLLPMLFIVLYNAPDNMLVPMLNKFLIGRGFIGTEIAMAGKLFGYVGAAIGSILGSFIMRKISITSGLYWFGLIHAIAHSGYAFLADADKAVSNLMAITAIESVTGGMKIAACIGLTTALCSKSKSAGHYSFFSSALGVSRALLPSLAGVIASQLPWKFFFPLMSIIAIPSLLIAKRLNRILQNAIR